MSHLSTPASDLKAITINGAIRVESEEEVARRREERRKQRKSRWGRPQDTLGHYAAPPPKKSAILLPGEGPSSSTSSASGGRLALEAPKAAQTGSAGLQLPTLIDAGSMDEKSQQIYLCQMQIQEATIKLGRADLGIPANPRDRSPSPEPIYNNKGFRINKREDRVRSRLVNQRNAAISKLKTLDPTYQPPSHYKFKEVKLEDRVLIPAVEYPHINFMGLLLGPRGNFLEELKAKTKCNIIIRGKGSLKSGMTGINKDGKKFEALDEPLHAFIQGNTAEDVKNGAKEVQELIDMQVYNPDCEKAVALRAKHMHDLAILNGTLKDMDFKCLNCGRTGHKSWECDEKSVFTASVICSACGGVGHLTADCRQRRPGSTFNKKGKSSNPEVIDKEYDAFLEDLGVEPKGKKKKKEDEKAEEPYVPPDMGLGRTAFSSSRPAPPLMLTNGSNAPGAASAHARAVSAGEQMPGGALAVMGQSIFGGRLTRLTSGFKSKSEQELEREKKRQEAENGTPVPLEWQVEKYEKGLNKSHEAYLKRLERESQAARAQKQGEMARCLAMAPPPPPPGGGGGGPSSSSSGSDLPELVGMPLWGLRR